MLVCVFGCFCCLLLVGVLVGCWDVIDVTRNVWCVDVGVWGGMLEDVGLG